MCVEGVVRVFGLSPGCVRGVLGAGFCRGFHQSVLRVCLGCAWVGFSAAHLGNIMLLQLNLGQLCVCGMLVAGACEAGPCLSLEEL